MPIPGQELIEPLYVVIGDPRQHIGKPSLISPIAKIKNKMRTRANYFF